MKDVKRNHKWYSQIAKIYGMSAILLKMYFIANALFAILRIFPNSCTSVVIFSVWLLFHVFITLKIDDLLKLVVDKFCDKSPRFQSNRIVVLD